MSLRHTPRQSDRDIRLHDPHAPHHAHSLPPPPPAHLLGAHPPHLNGTAGPTPPQPHPGPAAHPPPSLVSPQAMSSAVPNGVAVPASIQKLAQANEQTWLLIGRVAEQMGNLEHALSAYENALRHNPHSLSGLTQVAGIARIKENYPKAVDYFQRVINMQQDNGEVWSALGHCYLMQDDLQKAYAAYQQALYLLPNPKEDPKLWYGIGILYDRYGSLDHAEEAFSSVLKMDKDFDKANEILFRLGIIYKQQGKYAESLECFDRILRNPPNPLAHADIWFQIGHVFEQQRDHIRARDAYERVVQDNPGHAKVLQQLGWLYHQDGSTFQNQEVAIQYLTKSLEADPSDAQSWYLLGRAYMAGQKYNKAYEAYQQAVYRDGRNPTFWCSIGVLYFQINQYRDALDAYSRAIRINPYISEVWFDLGSLYESCNNQISDAIDAYARAAELDPSNTAITQRLQLLRTAQATGSALPAAPGPQDVHPTAYANLMPPGTIGGAPMLLQVGHRPLFRADSRGPGDLPVPVPTQQMNGRSSPGPFRGGPPPPVVLDDNRVPSHTPLAPMDIDRPPMHSREASGVYPPPRENGPRGPAGQGLLLHHPVPQQQPPPESLRGSAHPQPLPHERSTGGYRVHSDSASPPPHSAVANGRPSYADNRPPIGPGQTPVSARRTPPPPPYGREPSMSEREPSYIRMVEQHDWAHERPRRVQEYAPQQHVYPHAHSSPPPPPRVPSPRHERSPVEVSPPSAHAHTGFNARYWDPRTNMPSGPAVMPPRSPVMQEPAMRRYDPRFDAREAPREYERGRGREHEREPIDPRYSSPESARAVRESFPPPAPGSYGRTSESPRMPQGIAADADKRRQRRNTKDKDSESGSSVPASDQPKKERKRRPPQKRVKEEPARVDSPSYSAGPSGYRQKAASPDGSTAGSGSAGRSVQPSPTSSAPLPPSRVVDEDYDGDVVEALVDMHNISPRYVVGPGVSRVPVQSPHSAQRRDSLPMRPSPPLGTKRARSPGPGDDVELKRSRTQRVSPQSTGRPTPTPSSRMSPIPFRHQPTSHSPEAQARVAHDPHEARSYPPSPSLPTTLPPHPRPIGNHALPPPMARSPARAGSSEERERMHARSASPLRTKREIVPHPTGASSASPPQVKGTPSPSSSNGRSGPIP